MHLQKHIEGGYFVETDRDTYQIPNPFLSCTRKAPSFDTLALLPDSSHHGTVISQKRSASTSIFYLLTPSSPQGGFHRNKARTIHTLHKGRGRYVIIHADEVRYDSKARVETFVVGGNVMKGEKLQWIVEGGKYKASFLLEDKEGGEGSREGLLISEVRYPLRI